MVALKIEDRKQFTSGLFVGELFDQFLMKEAVIVTYNTFTIDGRIRQGYYSDEELEQNKVKEYSFWKTMKPFCFSIIKGKRLPGSFQIVLQLSPGDTEEFLNQRKLPVKQESVSGLYVNIRYEGDVMHCVTGTSLNFFTLDKSLDHEWDQEVKDFLKEKHVAFEVES